jgi:hypothetical protein
VGASNKNEPPSPNVMDRMLVTSLDDSSVPYDSLVPFVCPVVKGLLTQMHTVTTKSGSG